MKEFVACSRVDSVQPLMVFSRAVFRHGNGVNRAIGSRRARDDRGGSNPDFRADLIAATIVGRRLSRFERPYVPNRSTGVSIEGIDAVMFRRHDEQIVSTAFRADRRKIQRLRVDLAVDGDGEQLAEASGVYVGSRENRLCGVQAGAGVVVVVGPNILPES